MKFPVCRFSLTLEVSRVGHEVVNDELCFYIYFTESFSSLIAYRLTLYIIAFWVKILNKMFIKCV